MIGTQPQLIPIALNPSDVVYTPDWVARDMVDYFKPHGRILEPCAGDGVFLKYLPEGTEWCEIERGRDFFQWVEPVDWIVGNPPYDKFSKWLQHSFKVSNNVVYILPANKPFNSYLLIGLMQAWGEIVHMRHYGVARHIFGDIDLGFSVAAIHFQRNYHGGMTMSYYEGNGRD